MQDQRTHSIFGLQPPILHILLPRPAYRRCDWWQAITNELNLRPFNNLLGELPVLPLPFYNEEALRPLPVFPQDGFLTGLSLQPETTNIEVHGDELHPPPLP